MNLKAQLYQALNPTPDIERDRLISAQVKLQLFNTGNWACFFPREGFCEYCLADLVAIKKDKLETEMVTGCPVCNRSYCE